MNAAEIDQLAEGWISDWESDKKIVYGGDDPSAKEIVSDLDLDESPEKLWAFILAAYPKDMSGRVRAILAAGPLEDLLAHFGPDYIERVETLARQDPKFNDLLGGVWRNDMSEDVWGRVTRIRNNAW